MNKLFRKVVATSILTVFLGSSQSSACTIMAVGKKATADGSVLISHTNDGLGDPRAIYVPAMDHPKGAKRAIYYSHNALGYKPQYGSSNTVRLNTDQFGPGYIDKKIPKSVPIGYIPQVAHTYAYIDSSYSVMNEHQVIMGECTDKAKVEVQPEPGKRLFYSSELARVAMERAKTAREAIKVIGDMIDTYGYYGTGETLAIGDPNEAWVMEMTAYDMQGTDGVWVAKRVPDDEFFIAGNQFRIRDIIKDKPSEMVYSKNIFQIAEIKGWWKPEDGALDFTKVYGDGEYHHPYYSKRRVWRGMSLVAPSKNLSPWVKSAISREYPFAIKPDNKLDAQDIVRILRDNYEGTEFDLTKGPAAGPFGNPNRFEGGAESAAGSEHLTYLKGYFERPINIYRCVYYHVSQARSWLPNGVGGVTWYAPDRAATSIPIPIYAGAKSVPTAVSTGSVLEFNKKSLWTANNYMANLLTLRYDKMYGDLDARRKVIVGEMLADQEVLEDKAKALYEAGKEDEASKLLADFSANTSQKVLDSWWQLATDLFITYEDGYRNTAEGIGQPLFYPADWLKEVGYEKDETSYSKQ